MSKDTLMIFQIFFLITSLLIMFLTLFMPVEINYEYELEKVGYGYPLHFMEQKPTLDPPLPYSLDFQNIWDNPTKLNFTNFFLSLLILEAIFNFFYFSIMFLIKIFSSLGRK